MKHRGNVVLLITALVICLVSLFWSHQSNKYSIRSIMQLDSVRLSVEETSPAIQSARHFAEDMVNAYRDALIARVNPTFQKEFPLLGTEGISARFVFSSVAECLLYLFPDKQNILYADLIRIPVQPPLMHGLIPLDLPVRSVNPGPLSMESIRRAAREKGRPPGGIPAHRSVSMMLEAGVTLSLDNGMQLFDFPRTNSLGLAYRLILKVSNTAEWYKDALGSTASFELTLKGPLIISSEKDFIWATNEKIVGRTKLARYLGKQMAESDVSELMVKQPFFRKSLADPTLKPLAEKILSKKARVEKDPDFSYPLWEQDLDARELRSAAERLRIDGSYVDRLLGEKRAFASGFLLGYFENAREFMTQWIVINLGIMILLGIGYATVPLMSSSLKKFMVELSLVSAICGINWQWIFFRKPESVTGWYLILPGLLWAANLIMVFMLSERANTKATRTVTK